MSTSGGARSPQWKWYICGILLLATMLNYMDRQTLANTITDISKELGLNNEQYGQLEFGFGMAFAAGGILVGFLVDRLSVRWMYPLVLIGWSSAGIATAYADQIGHWLQSAGFGGGAPPGYVGLMACRITLGLFEAGQWPCAWLRRSGCYRPKTVRLAIACCKAARPWERSSPRSSCSNWSAISRAVGGCRFRRSGC